MSNQSINFNEEKLLNPTSGFLMLFIGLLGIVAGIAGFIASIFLIESGVYTALGVVVLILGIVGFITFIILICGLTTVNPNEAEVLVLFGNYYGTIARPGFFWVNPFCSKVNPAAAPSSISVKSTDGNLDVNASSLLSKKISLKAITLNNGKQKVNDSDGNPIEIGVVVIWKVVNATKAVFEVDNYNNYVSTQTDAAIRQVARQYPYDISNDGDEKSLRGSASEVAEDLKTDLQKRVELAGIEILEARIAHLAYAPEIAAAMLQRQQASAIIDARQKIVEGAVSMVEMALDKLTENDIVVLDDERKAAMVSNLLVVLCGNKDAQPIVNSGSIY